MWNLIKTIQINLSAQAKAGPLEFEINKIIVQKINHMDLLGSLD